MTKETYRKYFDIDPDFFPAVNSDVIEKEPDLWKKYFPHETFVKLLKQIVSVLDRSQKLNIWVEGAYGTGKSHAVLTLKHLLDVSEDETTEYFQKFKLDDDLRKKFNAAKGNGRVITVHRYGSSSIHSDNDLFLAMQESIEDALEKAGIQNMGVETLKGGIIKYLSEEENKRSIEVYVTGSYKEMFGGDGVDEIVKHLLEYSGQALQSLMNNLFKLGNERNIKIFTIDAETMAQWISKVISVNSLKAIVFIWDEFTEYFSNNAHRLTGLQRILDMSQTEPFCFIPVTHRKDAGMVDSDQDKRKILGRFISPSCIIELPENMAFQLMGAAMQVNNDVAVKKEWEEIKNDMVDRTTSSREAVRKYAKIDDRELRNILPIHPYTACLLKQISTYFASNQRSMFDFIKNVGNTDTMGFQWFIDNHGPLDQNPFLTIDLLWGFFYERGKDELASTIRQTLDRYGSLSEQMDDDEKKVFKAILLFQAMSLSAGDAIDIFKPNEKNLDMAFEGTDFEAGQAVRCAEKLIRDKVIYKKALRDGTSLYSVHTGEIDAVQIELHRPEYEKRTTSSLIKGCVCLNESITLPACFKARFKMRYAGITDFDAISGEYISKSESDPLHFYVVVCLSKSDQEHNSFVKKIEQARSQRQDSDVIYVDCGKTPLGDEKFDKWVENMTYSAYYAGKDNSQATQYNKYAEGVLEEWRNQIAHGQFVLYVKMRPSGYNVNSVEGLVEELRIIDKKRYPLSLECNYKTIDTWWDANALATGAECGITRNLKGTYTNTNASLKKSLSFAWTGDDEYWKNSPAETISQIKSALEVHIQEALEKDGRISISDIYDFLSEGKTGFLPCNITAFFMGFLLKEYVDDKYSWSDGVYSDSMSVQKMKEMVEEVIKHRNTPIPRYHDKFIVTMTPEEKAFLEGTAEAFDLSKNSCSSIEAASNLVRNKMKNDLSFPIWSLAEILEELLFSTPIDVIKELITSYLDLTNNTTGRTDNNIANQIGHTFLNHKNAASELHNILSQENCKKGMLKYLVSYREGELPTVAAKIGDRGQYINELRRKIGGGDANWLWKKDTVNQLIDDVILEYNIAAETAELLYSVTSYKEAIDAWNEKTANIKVALETVRNYVTGVLPLLNVLKQIKISGNIQGDKKEDFLNLLKGYGKAFNDFYGHQIEVFKQACSVYLTDLSDSDIDKLFQQMSSGAFTLDNTTYRNRVESEAASYKKSLGSSKLKRLWKDRTGTNSPKEWSEEYCMPILIMIPENEYDECQGVFETLNGTNTDEKSITKALKYLEDFAYWGDLADSEKRDKAFKEKMIGDDVVLIPDIEKVKEYISLQTRVLPYYWNGSGQVKKLITDYAQRNYSSNGYKIAIEKIDCLDEKQAKEFLKELIKNNMIVGVQIIKSTN